MSRICQKRYEVAIFRRSFAECGSSLYSAPPGYDIWFLERIIWEVYISVEDDRWWLERVVDACGQEQHKYRSCQGHTTLKARTCDPNEYVTRKQRRLIPFLQLELSFYIWAACQRHVQFTSALARPPVRFYGGRPMLPTSRVRGITRRYPVKGTYVPMW